MAFVITHVATRFPVATFFMIFFLFFSLGGGRGGDVGVEGWKWRKWSGR